MASNTPKLNLLKKNPATDGNETFNIKTMLNDNWDKIDDAVGDLQEAVQDIHVPNATLDQAGIVQLSNATNGSRENVAATEKAVKSVSDSVSAHLADETAHGIGNKATLLTTNKTSIVAAINEAFTFANNGKTAISTAVNAKGVPASPTDTFPLLATKIGQIQTPSPHGEQKYLTPGTYSFVVPANVTKLHCTSIGGGGGGGERGTNEGQPGGGGGGGGHNIGSIVVTPGQSISVTVGAGGAGGSGGIYSGNSGMNGTESNIGIPNIIFRALGGGGGQGGSGGTSQYGVYGGRGGSGGGNGGTGGTGQPGPSGRSDPGGTGEGGGTSGFGQGGNSMTKGENGAVILTW